MENIFSKVVSFLVIPLLFFILSVNFLPFGVVAQTDPITPDRAEDYVPPVDGLVTCGRGESGPMSCTFLELWRTVDNAMSFFIYAIVFPVSIILIIYAGGRMVWYASTNPGKAKDSKNILMNVIIGFAIVFSSYVVVKWILDWFVNSSGPLGQAMDFIFGG